MDERVGKVMLGRYEDHHFAGSGSLEADAYEARLNAACEHWFLTYPNAVIGSGAFYEVCNQFDVECDDLEDAIFEASYRSPECEAHLY